MYTTFTFRRKFSVQTFGRIRILQNGSDPDPATWFGSVSEIAPKSFTQVFGGINTNSILPGVRYLFYFQCFEDLVIKGNLNNMVCMKAFISKVLGLGIVVGSSLVKLPQVHTNTGNLQPWCSLIYSSTVKLLF